MSMQGSEEKNSLFSDKIFISILSFFKFPVWQIFYLKKISLIKKPSIVEALSC